jgi:glucose/arabinose dehydrogenase
MRTIGMGLVVIALAATVSIVHPLLANDRQSMLEAAAAGKLEVVRSLLARGVSPDTSDESGRTALMIAAYHGDREVVAALLDQGATVDARTPEGDTALMVAASRGHVEVVRLLLEREVDSNAGSADDATAATRTQENQPQAVVGMPLSAPAPPHTVFVGSTAPPTSALTLQPESTPRLALASIQLEPVLTGLSSPLYVTHARDGTNRLFVVEQPGRIKVLQPQASTPTVFLDIASRVLSGGERGLLGLAFHPDYAVNRRFFVNYTRQVDGATVIAEYHASPADPDVANDAETVLLVIPQPFANHNGGMVEFGPDGFLYIGMGDGGSGNDPGNRAQNINELLGKILRINVDSPSPPALYSSPPDNPFFGSTLGRDEIYAVGLRNPFRFSFDRGTGELIAGDVGQDAREEIDIVTRGGNYGWRVFEGTLCTGLDPASCSSAGFIGPIAEYDHTGGRCSITGGYVYRGTRGTLPEGTYVYGDFCSGEILQLLPVTSNGTQTLLLDTALSIASFGEDEAGEIYVVGLEGTVFRLAASSPPPGGGGPEPASPPPPSEGGSGSGGGSCFIATAAFGSPLAQDVQALRNFRDRYLATNVPGRVFIALYYRLSPPVADLISQHHALRAATRLILRPAIWGARFTETSPGWVFALLPAVAAGGGLLGYGSVRRWRRSRLLPFVVMNRGRASYGDRILKGR